MNTSILEFDLGTGDEISHSASDQHLARPGDRADACREVYRDAGDVVSDYLAFPRTTTTTNMITTSPSMRQSRTVISITTSRWCTHTPSDVHHRHPHG